MKTLEGKRQRERKKEDTQERMTYNRQARADWDSGLHRAEENDI